MKIILSTTVPCTLDFLTQTIAELQRRGHTVVIASSGKEELDNFALCHGVEAVCVPFYRGMNPWKDLIAIRSFTKILRKLRPDIVVGATPKAAMVSMISSKLAGIRIRIYHIYGLTYETAKGIKLVMLKNIERLTGYCASHIIPIGSSVKESTLMNKLYPEYKFLQKGLLTVGGVNTERFSPDKLIADRKIIRQQLGIREDQFVIGYVARLTYDKGFCDLIKVWEKIQQDESLQMIIAGEMDERVPLDEVVLQNFIKHPRVHYMGQVSDVERMFSAMDMFLFPSYREGFGNVNIEASAMMIPVITYDVTGCKDSVADGVSGYVVPFQDYTQVIEKVQLLKNNQELRHKLGCQGRIRVEENFTTDIVANNFVDIIEQLEK